MEKRKIILYITPFARPNIGGAETSVDKLIRFTAEHGYYPVLITYQPLTTRARGAPHEIGNGFEIYRVSWFGNGWFNKLENYFPLSFIYLFPGLFLKSLTYYLQNSKNICCIHAHGFVSGFIANLLTLLKKNRKVISTHAVYNFEKRRLLGYIIKSVLLQYDKILAVSEVAREELLLLGLNPNKVSIHKNWVDTDKWKPSHDGTGYITDKKFNLLFVGRLLEKKGIEIFIESARKLPDYGFHIVGSGPMEEYVKESAKNFKNIKFYGILNQENQNEFIKLVEIYSKSDFLISPYTYDEGFATILVESLACGTPVIVTDRGSPPTFLNKNVAYFLSNQPTAEELAGVLRKLETNGKNLFERAKCREFAVQNFGSKNALDVIKTYEQN